MWSGLVNWNQLWKQTLHTDLLYQMPNSLDNSLLCTGQESDSGNVSHGIFPWSKEILYMQKAQPSFWQKGIAAFCCPPWVSRMQGFLIITFLVWKGITIMFKSLQETDCSGAGSANEQNKVVTSGYRCWGSTQQQQRVGGHSCMSDTQVVLHPIGNPATSGVGQDSALMTLHK